MSTRIRAVLEAALADRARGFERFVTLDLIAEVADQIDASTSDVAAEIDAFCATGGLDAFGYVRSGDSFTLGPPPVRSVAPPAGDAREPNARIPARGVEPIHGRIGHVGGIESITVDGARWFFGFDYRSDMVVSPLIAAPEAMADFASRYMEQMSGPQPAAFWRELVDESVASSELSMEDGSRDFSAAMLAEIVTDLRDATSKNATAPQFSLPYHFRYLLGASCAFEVSSPRLLAAVRQHQRAIQALRRLGMFDAEWFDVAEEAIPIIRGAARPPASASVADAAFVIHDFLGLLLTRAPANWPEVFASLKHGLRTIETTPLPTHEAQATRAPVATVASVPLRKIDCITWHAGASDFPAALRDECACLPMGFFLAWAILRDWTGPDVPRDDAANVRRKKSAGPWIVTSRLDGALTNRHFSERGNAFAAQYYEAYRERLDAACQARGLASSFYAPNDATSQALASSLLDDLAREFEAEEQRADAATLELRLRAEYTKIVRSLTGDWRLALTKLQATRLAHRLPGTLSKGALLRVFPVDSGELVRLTAASETALHPAWELTLSLDDRERFAASLREGQTVQLAPGIVISVE